MSDPVFATLEIIMRIHAESLARYGGNDGVLNESLLESAVFAPQHSFGGKYLLGFPYEMAASYLISLSRNHAFQDGNKRTAAATCLWFLIRNGVKPTASEKEWLDITLKAATGEWQKAKIASWIEAHTQVG